MVQLKYQTITQKVIQLTKRQINLIFTQQSKQIPITQKKSFPSLLLPKTYFKQDEETTNEIARYLLTVYTKTVQIYSYVHSIHSAHLKKLQSIKNHRKTQLSIDKSRTIMIDKIRRNKAFTFASSFNNEYDQINRKNQSILKKMATIKPSTACEVKRYSNRSNDEKRMNSSRISLKEIQKQRQVSKQNQRLYVKLKTMESNLKKEKFKYMHQQTQRIKQRIMRYSQDMDQNGKITLKSQQFVSLPKTSHLSREHRLKEMNQTTKTSDLNHSRRSTIAQHYKKEQIQKNTLENIHKRYSTINALSPHKSSTSKKFSARKYEQNEEERTFLTVQQQQRKTLKINEVQQSSQRNRISFAKNNLEKLKMLDNQKPAHKKN